MKTVINKTEKQVSKVVTNKVNKVSIESKKIDLLKAVTNEAKKEIDEKNEIRLSIYHEAIKVADLTQLNELKIKVKETTFSNKEKLSLQILINKKVCILKLDDQKNKLNERNEKQKPLNEKTTFKKDVKVNLLSLNNIVTTIKKADKKRIFEGKEISSKYQFLFVKGFNNSTFYGMLTLSQFSKILTKGEFFNSDTITENCERLTKKDFREIESICNKGFQVKELIKNENKLSFQSLINEFTKL